MKALDIINKCIEETKNISQEEFNRRLLKIKNYDTERYVDDEFKIILPLPMKTPKLKAVDEKSRQAEEL